MQLKRTLWSQQSEWLRSPIVCCVRTLYALRCNAHCRDKDKIAPQQYFTPPHLPLFFLARSFLIWLVTTIMPWEKHRNKAVCCFTVNTCTVKLKNVHSYLNNNVFILRLEQIHETFFLAKASLARNLKKKPKCHFNFTCTGKLKCIGLVFTQ